MPVDQRHDKAVLAAQMPAAGAFLEEIAIFAFRSNFLPVSFSLCGHRLLTPVWQHSIPQTDQPAYNESQGGGAGGPHRPPVNTVDAADEVY
jgi:hypothetical protein